MNTPGCGRTTLQLLQAVSVPPTPVLPTGLSCKPPVPASAHPSKHVSQAGMPRAVAWLAVYAGHPLFCLPQTNHCTLLWASEAPFSVPTALPASEGASRGAGTFPLFQLPPRGTGPISLPLFFPFCPTQFCGNFLVLSGIWGLLLVFCRRCESCSTCRLFLMYLWEGDSFRVLLHHFD